MQKALEELRQGLLYGFWIVQRYALEPALAGALGNSLGVALVLAVMKMAEAQSAARWALAAGAVFLPLLAFACVGDGHRAFVRLWSLSATPPPCLLQISQQSAVSRVFGRNSGRIKDLDLGRMEPVAWNLSHGTRRMKLDLFSRTIHDVRSLRRAQVEMSHGGRGKLMFCFAALGRRRPVSMFHFTRGTL